MMVTGVWGSGGKRSGWGKLILDEWSCYVNDIVVWNNAVVASVEIFHNHFPTFS